MFHFSEDDIVVGYKAAAQSDHNPDNTIYDAKRFIGKQFRKNELTKEAERYQFKVILEVKIEINLIFSHIFYDS